MSDKAAKRIFKKGDIVILLLLLAAVVLTVVFAVSGGADTVEIYCGGKLVYRTSLSADGDYSLLDGRMTVTVSGGKVMVSQSDCPEQLCVHSSPVGPEGGMIACLPNKVVIKITGGEVDSVTQ